MPYLTFSFFGYTESMTLWMSWEGKVIFILAILELLFIFKDLLKKYLPQLFQSSIGQKIDNLNDKLSLVLTILAAVLALILTINTIDGMDFDLGFWIFWIGIICLVGHALLYNKQQQPTPIYGQPVNQTMGMQPNYNQQINQPVGTQPINYQPTNQQVGVQPTNYQQMNQQVGAQPINYQPSQNMNEPINFCPSCGNKIDENTRRCLGCGRQF